MTGFDVTAPDFALRSENARLQAELRARARELRACRGRVLGAIEAERRRIERDLHDGVQGRLVSVAMSLGLLDAKLAADDAAKPIARDAREAVASALVELRRFSQGMYPSVLAERGLTAAIEELCEHTTFPVQLGLAIPNPLPPQLEAVAYFLTSEALANVAKHSHARQARIDAWHHEGRVSIAVADNGVGGAAPGARSGLQNIAERVEAVGGRLFISSPRGAGTTIRAELPYG